MKTTLKKLTQLVAVSAALLLQSCGEDDEAAVAPKVSTVNATEITFSSAKLGGTVTSSGGAGIIAKGIAFATSTMPTIFNDTTNQGEGTEGFTVTLTELLPNTTYYARAYATNKVGTSYGEEFSFLTQSGTPTVEFNATDILYKKITAHVQISDIGASGTTLIGFAFSTTNTQPTMSDAMWNTGSSELSAEQILEGLEPGTKYYIRGMAQNAQGMGYSPVVEITTKAVPASITDVDGNVYGTKLIGERVWLTSNLKVTKYNNGDPIATTADGIDGETTPKYQWPANDDVANVPTYGRVYTYFAVEDARKACPAGTHVSTQDDWSDLNSVINGAGWRLKTSGTNNWLAPNTASNNEVGFGAVGSGYRSMYGSFMSFKEYAFYITPQQDTNEPNNVTGYYVTSNDGYLWVPSLSKKSGYSVRCVVD